MQRSPYPRVHIHGWGLIHTRVRRRKYKLGQTKQKDVSPGVQRLGFVCTKLCLLGGLLPRPSLYFLLRTPSMIDESNPGGSTINFTINF